MDLWFLSQLILWSTYIYTLFMNNYRNIQVYIIIIHMYITKYCVNLQVWPLQGLYSGYSVAYRVHSTLCTLVAYSIFRSGRLAPPYSKYSGYTYCSVQCILCGQVCIPIIVCTLDIHIVGYSIFRCGRGRFVSLDILQGIE